MLYQMFNLYFFLRRYEYHRYSSIVTLCAEDMYIYYLFVIPCYCVYTWVAVPLTLHLLRFIIDELLCFTCIHKMS